MQINPQSSDVVIITTETGLKFKLRDGGELGLLVYSENEDQDKQQARIIVLNDSSPRQYMGEYYSICLKGVPNVNIGYNQEAG